MIERYAALSRALTDQTIFPLVSTGALPSHPQAWPG